MRQTVLFGAMAIAVVSFLSSAGTQPLDLPLTVHERSGVSRRGAVVTSGVPLPLGYRHDPAALVVVDGANRPLPTQVSVISRWWKPAHDDSLRWIRVSFPCDVAAGATGAYRLVDRASLGDAEPVASAQDVVVRETGEHIAVRTGVAEFLVPRGGGLLLKRASFGDTTLVEGAGLVAVGAAWPEMGMKDGAIYGTENRAVEIEERGPVRAVIKIDSVFVGKGTGAFDGDLYHCRTRLYFERGSARLRLVTSIKNSHLADDVYTWPLRDVSLLTQIAPGEAPRARLLGEGRPIAVDLHRWKSATMHQNSSGGEQWRDLTKKKNYARWLAKYTKGATVRGVSYRGYRITSPAGVLEEGSAARGVLDVGGRRGGLTVAQRNFRVRYPGTLAASRSSVRVGLWPGEFSEPIFLTPGQRITRELTLTLRGPDQADLDATHRALDRRLLFLAPPSWYASSGGWDGGLARAHGLAPTRRSAPRREPPPRSAPSRAEGERREAKPKPDDNVNEPPPWRRRGSTRIVPLPGPVTHPSRLAKGLPGARPAAPAPAPEAGSKRAAPAPIRPAPIRPGPGPRFGSGYDKRSLDGVDVGWDWYGWFKGYNAGGGHWNQWTCFAETVLNADFAEFDRAEARTFWAADTALLHFDPADLDRYWLKIRGYRWNDVGIRFHKWPGWYDRAQWRSPDAGHLGMFMWFEYYNLTGDRRVLDSCLALGQLARSHLWRHNHDDVAGAGPGGNDVTWCRKRDPDDPTFLLHHRAIGWPLYDLTLLYQLTGDEQILRECANVAAGFRNTARWAPSGFLTTWWNKPGSKDMYGGQLATGPPRTDSGSMLFANFHVGIIMTALVQFYRETLEEDALDTLIGCADFYTHQIMLRDRQGRMHGWSYVFGDYWGPYSLDEFVGRWRPNWLNQNFRIVQPLGWIYLLTGREDYREVLETALAKLRGPGKKVMAAVQALRTERSDRTPPAAITDLAAKVEAGRVTLRWTAPGDDGKTGTAARYQVKYSTSPIVERVKGWPDRTPPLPTTRDEWEAKAAAFRAKQRAFWAVHNVAGEPKPEPAGAIQSFRLTLPAGTYYLAVKTWDDGPNMSALSNVVRVTVGG